MIENQSSAFTITIIPAASFSLSSLERLVKSMRTGMRCCILTKFPAELSVGTNEYLEPVAPDMAVIVPVNSLSTDCIYGDGNLLSYMQVFPLEFPYSWRQSIFEYRAGYK